MSNQAPAPMTVGTVKGKGVDVKKVAVPIDTQNHNRPKSTKNDK